VRRTIESLVLDETARREAFPVSANRILVSHAGVTALPKCAGDAMTEYVRRSCEEQQEFSDVWREVKEARRLSAALIGAEPDEIALLGPTSLGLSLFANGLPWQRGDEILCYQDDYPANVYPWLAQEAHGVTVRYLSTKTLGEITPELIETSLTPKTRLVALASCHFLSGYRIDIDAIGQLLRDRGILFSLDAIQTLGAFPVPVKHVDFLSADAHKWMLGPMAIGIVYVKKERFDLLRPTLLGAWNVDSPNFITRDEIRFAQTAQRYEPGVLNAAGICGMRAVLEMLLEVGIDTIAERILELKAQIVDDLEALGFEVMKPMRGPTASGITTFRHPERPMRLIFDHLAQNNVSASFRYDREDRQYVRFSPHFYNTHEELNRIRQLLQEALV
jgi:cysteine desulfurase / selenocysteine lyase